MPRVVIVRSSDCGLSESELSEAFAAYFPDDFILVDANSTLGEIPDGNDTLPFPAFPLAVARIDAAKEFLDFEDADIYVALARGKVRIEERPVEFQVAVAALIGNITITFLFLSGQGDVVCTFPEGGDVLQSFKEPGNAIALARIIAAYDARGLPKHH
ncbi:MAG: hypothetical protein AAB480_04995 [Patescibacteria group bacterium]